MWDLVWIHVFIGCLKLLSVIVASLSLLFLFLSISIPLYQEPLMYID